MSRYFVAVGGTGQHVALGLSDYLVLAHSVVPDPVEPVTFVLLDADPASGREDKPSAWQLCSDQLAVLNRWPDRLQAGPEHITRPPLPSLSDGVRSAAEAVNEKFGVGAADLFLSPSQSQIAVTSGYHGEPRIAALLTDVLIDDLKKGRLDATDALRRLKNALLSDGARICVSGSAIGGTGAGVLPRLIETFAATKGRSAHLAAIVGLEWFQLTENAQLERMRANAVSTLWHYARTSRELDYRLFVWGHPNVAGARHEEDCGRSRQSAKSDLTLPLAAAAAAAAFIWGDEQRPERVAAASVQGAPRLTPALSFGQHDLRWLLDRNADLLGRLDLVRRYLEHPYDGAVLPLFRRRGLVPSADALSRAERVALVEKIDALVAAKTRAIQRLRASDASLGVPPSRRHVGIPTLQQWLKRETSVETLVSSLAEVRVDTGADATNARLLPDQAFLDAGAGNATLGGRAAIGPDTMGNLAPFRLVQPSRVPAPRGVEIVLDEVFKNPALYWGDGQLSAALIANEGPAIPVELGESFQSETYSEWVKRWFLLLSAFVCGEARIEAQTHEPLGITHSLTVNRYDTGESCTVGYLSPKVGVVPNLSNFWFDRATCEALAARVGVLRRSFVPWLRLITLVGECRFGAKRTPGWVRLLQDAFPVSGERYEMNARADVLPAAWGDEAIDLPLPARDGVNSRGHLADRAVSAFDLKVLDISSVPVDALPEELEIWNGIAAARTAAAMFANRDGNAEAASEQEVVWTDRLSDVGRRALFGDLFFVPNRGYAWRVATGPRFLELSRVLTAEVAVLIGADSQRLASVPIRFEYSPLLVNATSTYLPDGRVQCEVELQGREPETRVFSPSDVRQFQRLTIFSWPKITPSRNGSHFVLVSTNAGDQLSFRILYNRGDQASYASAAMSDSQYPQYLLGERGEPKHLSLAVCTPSGERADLGLVPFAWRAVVADAADEAWTVDLGTSSTVIARGPKSTDVISPTAERDATVVYSLGDGVRRRQLMWFPTWNEKAPQPTANIVMPSQVIDHSGYRDVPTEVARRTVGRDFSLDHGDELDPAYMDAVVDNLKWRSDAKGQFRVPFLVHLLEQAIAMETARRGTVPPTITTTFTLPLRQRDAAGRFTKEVHAVAQTVAQRTGIQIRPHFQWESKALAPEVVAGPVDQILIVADLGGGTLDLYAARYESGMRCREAVDSAYLGGHECVELLHNRIAPLQPLTEFQRSMRSGEIDRDAAAAQCPEVRAYFQILYRYIVAWSHALIKKWDVPHEIPIMVKLAGLGWALPGSARTQQGVASQLRQVAERIGWSIDFQAYPADAANDGPQGRKTLLARACSVAPGVAADLLSVGELEMVMGLASTQGRIVHEAAKEPRHVRALEDGAIVVDAASAALLMPEATDAELRMHLDTVANRLRKHIESGNVRAGALDPHTNELVVTPLTCLAEVAVEQLRGAR